MRSKKPKRGSRLKRTPLKRGVTPLKRKTPLRASKGLAAGKPLERRTPLKRGRWTRARWEQWDALDRRAHDAWRGKVTRRRCELCLHEGRQHDAHPKRDAHHVLPARYIRRYVRSLKLPSDEARLLLRSLLYDPRNGLCLDRRCHDKHETAFKRVPRALVSKKAEQFARELGMEHVLDRLYGERDSKAAALVDKPRL